MRPPIDIGGYSLHFVGEIEPERDGSGAVLEFMPQQRYKKRCCQELNRYGTGPFCRYRIPNDRHQEGTYAVTLGGEVVYVGKCRDLTKRHNMGYGQISPKNCYRGGQETNCRINSLILQCAKSGKPLGLWFLPTPDSSRIEAKLIESFSPSWNLQHNAIVR